jgi:hypothetical protein
MGWRSKITTTEINFSSQARDFKAEGSIFQAFQIQDIFESTQRDPLV